MSLSISPGRPNGRLGGFYNLVNLLGKPPDNAHFLLTLPVNNRPNWIRKLLKKNKDDHDNDKRGGGGAGGPGWDWDGNKKHYEDTETNRSNKAIQTGATLVVGGALLYILYRAVRLVPSLFPPLWATLPANIAIP